MKESGYYPPGAEFDPRAPYNEVKLPEKEFDVCISQSLSKNTTVSTSDYTVDDYGINTSTAWEEAYDKEHCTPYELINHFKILLETMRAKQDFSYFNKRNISFFIDECSNWNVDETVVVED